MSTTKRSRPRFRVGDWVSLLYGPRPMLAQVIEDRGPLGVNGRRLYGIRLDLDPEEPTWFEAPEESIQPAPAPDSKVVMAFLKEGGLVSILRSNLGGTPNVPKIWLTYTAGGDLTHTFLPDRGVIGGQPAPYWALLEEKVFKPKVEEVVTFLTCFGLGRTEADEVIRAVGTAP